VVVDGRIVGTDGLRDAERVVRIAADPVNANES
jgi:hypothetical protein